MSPTCTQEGQFHKQSQLLYLSTPTNTQQQPEKKYDVSSCDIVIVMMLRNRSYPSVKLAELMVRSRTVGDDFDTAEREQSVRTVRYEKFFTHLKNSK
jgi:hypothetical protein